jgi:hypothetical protein
MALPPAFPFSRLISHASRMVIRRNPGARPPRKWLLLGRTVRGNATWTPTELSAQLACSQSQGRGGEEGPRYRSAQLSLAKWPHVGWAPESFDNQHVAISTWTLAPDGRGSIVSPATTCHGISPYPKVLVALVAQRSYSLHLLYIQQIRRITTRGHSQVVLFLFSLDLQPSAPNLN